MRLIVLAIALVAAVLGVQVAHGGGDYVPLKPANPCVARAVPAIPARLEPLAEQVVLLGLDGAACRLGVSRERLVLALGDNQLTNTAPPALRAGLLDAVSRLDRAGALPKVSALLPEALDLSGLPGIAQGALERLPDSVVDGLLPTGPLLQRAVEGLDVQAILTGLTDTDALQKRIETAILDAAQAEIKARLLDKLPGPLRDLIS